MPVVSSHEDARVKIPAVIHLVRLGYTYLKLSDHYYDRENNIFDGIFKTACAKINHNIDNDGINKTLSDLKQSLKNEDLGKAFYKRIVDKDAHIKIIDFDNFKNNIFYVVTELPCQKSEHSDAFRPDITILINGLPLAFVEVKIPNNKDGIRAERNRMQQRFKNSNFKSYLNATQIMVFSNNQEYEDGQSEPLFGAFYGTNARKKIHLNYFREQINLPIPAKISDEQEKQILLDNNHIVIKSSPEFQANKQHNTPTNNLLTSLFSHDRLAFLLQYGFAYIGEQDIAPTEKHIMRYPQMFASFKIREMLQQGGKKGVIWHTQGSGKTALAYYNIKYIKEYYSAQGIEPKFYFVVDRLDLANQANREFSMRGLHTRIINNRADFAAEIKSSDMAYGSTHIVDIRIVNIQKFNEDQNIQYDNIYNKAIQNIFILDEAHRSYNEIGTNLRNLLDADKNAIRIALTGTPLIGNKRLGTKDIFGNYIHTYYYDQSIKDGYTLPLIREDIETSYQENLRKIIADMQVKQGSITNQQIFESDAFVDGMLEYIVKDFTLHRFRADATIGAMVVCQSSGQAKKLFDKMQSYQYENPIGKEPKKSALILHDEGTTESRYNEIKAFKDGEIDILFVFNMLLTGFDSPRLKKLYVTRVIKHHNLLQTLTRVNRPYVNPQNTESHKYGYVVDFADISNEFKKTNEQYWRELVGDDADSFTNYDNFFKSESEIQQELQQAEQALSPYTYDNLEIFQQQINAITEYKDISILQKALLAIKQLYNLCRSFGKTKILTDLKIDYNSINKYKQMFTMVNNRANAIRMVSEVQNAPNEFLKHAFEDIDFSFTKIGEQELKIIDAFRSIASKTRESFATTIDKDNPQYTTLKQELYRLLQKLDLANTPPEDVNSMTKEMENIYQKIRELNRQDDLLCEKYGGDKKYVVIHNHLLRDSRFSKTKIQHLTDGLLSVKNDIDTHLSNNADIQNNMGVFKRKIQQSIIKNLKPPLKIKNKKAIYYVTECMQKQYEQEQQHG